MCSRLLSGKCLTYELTRRTLVVSVTPIDDQGADGQPAATSTFVTADPAPILLGPDDGAVIHYPDEPVNLRSWWREGWTPWSYLDTDIAGTSGPLPALKVDLMPRLDPGTYRWTTGGPFWSQYGAPEVTAPIGTIG